jgi:cytochrome c553
MRTNEMNVGCPLTAGRTNAVPALLAATVLASATSAVRADAPDATATMHARTVAITICGTCHGPLGNNTNPKYPVLAGQNASYLAAQLKGFRSEARGDPDAISYMWGMAARLEDDTIAALAAYYTAQKTEASPGANAAAIATGRDIYQNGIPAEGVPACSSCHGPDAHGTKEFPRLAGQHSQYILKQLGSFQNNMRDVAIMHGVALNLRGPQMEAVAAFLEAQP